MANKNSPFDNLDEMDPYNPSYTPPAQSPEYSQPEDLVTWEGKQPQNPQQPLDVVKSDDGGVHLKLGKNYYKTPEFDFNNPQSTYRVAPIRAIPLTTETADGKIENQYNHLRTESNRSLFRFLKSLSQARLELHSIHRATIEKEQSDHNDNL